MGRGRGRRGMGVELEEGAAPCTTRTCASPRPTSTAFIDLSRRRPIGPSKKAPIKSPYNYKCRFWTPHRTTGQDPHRKTRPLYTERDGSSSSYLDWGSYASKRSRRITEPENRKTRCSLVHSTGKLCGRGGALAPAVQQFSGGTGSGKSTLQVTRAVDAVAANHRASNHCNYRLSNTANSFFTEIFFGKGHEDENGR